MHRRVDVTFEVGGTGLDEITCGTDNNCIFSIGPEYTATERGLLVGAPSHSKQGALLPWV